jgi:Mg-chelatase subunit ChlD
VASPSGLESFVDRLDDQIARAGGGTGQEAGGSGAERGRELFFEHEGLPGGVSRKGGPGAVTGHGEQGQLRPADGFPRRSSQPPDAELFHGIEHQDDDPGQPPGHSARDRLAALLGEVRQVLADHERGRRRAALHAPRAPEAQDLAAAVAQLEGLTLLSPTLHDTFLVNRDAAAWLLAKKAYRELERLMHRRHILRRGTHASGSRGLQTVLPDRVQPARRLSPRIAALPTLRRSLLRRATAPYAPLLDEADLVEYATRARVGCSVVIALDVSGAVQFGRRIQGVRRACLAFAYYIRRFHPSDRVRFVAYHETAAVVPFADVPRLRSLNGAGKNIGACLARCRDLLRQDADRVPVAVLIGDGLPARGACAGFYRFMENNREYIDGALDAARVLRQSHILFSFYQFREQRHLWQDYADAMAGRIAAAAGGTLYRIESPDTMALSLIASYERLRGALLR